MANAIRAERGFSVMKIEEDDKGKKTARGFGSVIAWDVDGSGPPKPVTPAGVPDGDYLIVTPDGHFQTTDGRTFRNREDAMGQGKDVNQTGMPTTQQQADQIGVSGGAAPVEEEQPLDPTGPTVKPGEVRVDRFNTVSGENEQVQRQQELRKAAEDFTANPQGKTEEARGGEKEQKPRASERDTASARGGRK